jgi:hypothetical protein
VPSSRWVRSWNTKVKARDVTPGTGLASRKWHWSHKESLISTTEPISWVPFSSGRGAKGVERTLLFSPHLYKGLRRAEAPEDPAVAIDLTLGRLRKSKWNYYGLVDAFSLRHCHLPYRYFVEVGHVVQDRSKRASSILEIRR